MSDYSTNASVNLNVNGKEAEETLARLKKRADDYKDAIAKASKEGNQTELKKLRKELRSTEREIKSIQSATVNVADVLRRLDKATPKELDSTLKRLTRELKNMERGTKAWDEQVRKIKEVKNQIAQVSNELKKNGTRWERVKRVVQEWQTMAVAAFAVIMKIITSSRSAVNAYAQMEQEMANVRKFTGMTAKQVEELNTEFQSMNTRTSREELNKLAQEAGRLGKTSKDEVLGFVRAADQINVALDDLGDGATLTLSKLTGIFGDEKRLGTEKSLLAVGSVINELSQNCSASAPYLAEFASRLGGVGAQAGMTIQQIMGYGAVLDSNNQKVEASATALAQVLTRLYQDPAKYAKPAGLEVKSFTKLLKEDANAALIQLLESLNKMGNMDVLSPIFSEMGETGSRAIAALSTLAGKIDEVKRQQAVANVAFQEATSIGKEFAVQNNTVQAGLDKAKKKFNEMAIDLGRKLLPVMKYTMSSSSALLHAISLIVDWAIKWKAVLIPLTSALVAYWTATKLAVVWNTSLNAITKLGTTIQKAYTYSVELGKIAMMAMNGQTKLANSSLKALNATMKSTPWGAIIAAVTAAGVAIYNLATKTDDYTQALNDAVKEAHGFTAETQKEQRELDILFGKLKGATEGSEDYNNIKNTIISKYGVYLQGLINEKGEIVNLTDAYNQLATAVRRAAVERGIAAAKEKINNEYYEQTSEWLNILQGNLEMYGASVQEAAELTHKVGAAFSANKAISQETLERLTYWSSQKPDPSKASSFGDWLDRMATNSVFGFPGGDNYYQPNEIINMMYGDQQKHQKAIANIDAMADGVAPLRKHDVGSVEMAVKSLQALIETGVDGSALVLDAAAANVVEFKEMTLNEAKSLLSEYQTELTVRKGGGTTQNTQLNEPELPDTKCPKCKKSPCICSKTDDPKNKDKFTAEKNWKEEEEALNRIAYATGEKNYDEYTRRIDQIAVEFYKKQLAHTDLSAQERLLITADYYDAIAKMQKNAEKKSCEDAINAENNKYNEKVALEKQRYLDGKISLETYNNTIETLELEHLKNIRDIYAKQVNAPIEEWKKARENAEKEMRELYQGNVDLMNRPQIDASKLKEKGWEDAGEGVATVFSSQYGILDANGTVREILVTPILPDGTVLSETELQNYISDVLEGSNDILADDNKGIVISVDVDPDGSAGERLHQLQELFYSSAPDVSNSQFASQYADASSKYSSAVSNDQLKKKQQTDDAKERFKANFFGDNYSEQSSKYKADLAMLQEVYNAEMLAAGNNADEKLRIEEAFQKAKLALAQKYNLLSIDDNRNAMEKANDKLLNWLESDAGQAVTRSFDVVMSGMSAIFSQVSSLVQAELEIETAAIEDRYDSEIAKAEGNAYKVKQLEEQKEKEIAKAKNEANKKMFAMQVIQAVAQTAQNALSAYGSAASIPVVGFVMAPIAAAMAVAAGALQIAAIKKQQQASEAQGYSKGGFTPPGAVDEAVGVVHAGEWVASQKLLANPVARPLINALDYAQRTNTIGALKADDVSRSISAPTRIASSNESNGMLVALNSQTLALTNYADSMHKLNDRLNEPFVTVNTVSGDAGIKKAQDDYDKLMRNKTPKSKRK